MSIVEFGDLRQTTHLAPMGTRHTDLLGVALLTCEDDLVRTATCTGPGAAVAA